MALMSEGSRPMSEGRDPKPVRRDRKSAESLDPLTEVIAEELFARTSRSEIGWRRSTTLTASRSGSPPRCLSVS